MLCLKNRKVYVGYIEYVLPMRAESKPYITILPAWSGYRDKDTLEVVPTTDYTATYYRMTAATADDNQFDIDMYIKTVCIDDIESANLYDDNSFAVFTGDADQDDVGQSGETIVGLDIREDDG